MERGLAAPAALSQRTGPPSRAPHFLKALCREEPPQKVHSDLLSPSLSCRCVPCSSQANSGACAPRRGAEGPVFPLWTRAVFASSEYPSVKEYVTRT